MDILPPPHVRLELEDPMTTKTTDDLDTIIAFQTCIVHIVIELISFLWSEVAVLLLVALC